MKERKKNMVILANKNIEIKQQKKLVDIKNQEIIDSIQYAKKIQNAILPPREVVKKFLPNSFILYKPKDIVAGDFYWLEAPLRPPIGGKQEAPSNSPKGGEQISSHSGRQGGVILFAAADCTGHGVPGAMVSVVCNNALNRSVREHGLIEPGKILDKTRELVVEEFNRSQEVSEKSEEEVKDGMDIALCALTFPKIGGAGGWLLQYAGANNPLWLIRKNQDGAAELVEVKADKQPIGKTDNPKPFTTHEIEVQSGDTFYIFSDGYADQFGGPQGKKLKSKVFKEILITNANKPLHEINSILDDTIVKWQGSLEQIDDICVIGVRL